MHQDRHAQWIMLYTCMRKYTCTVGAKKVPTTPRYYGHTVVTFLRCFYGGATAVEAYSVDCLRYDALYVSMVSLLYILCVHCMPPHPGLFGPYCIFCRTSSTMAYVMRTAKHSKILPSYSSCEKHRYCFSERIMHMRESA